MCIINFIINHKENKKSDLNKLLVIGKTHPFFYGNDSEKSLYS